LTFETLGEKDAALRDTFTLRERDSMKQDRVKNRRSHRNYLSEKLVRRYKIGLPRMRTCAYVLLALLSCSCTAVRIQTCGDAVPRLGPGRTVISDIDDTIKDTTLNWAPLTSKSAIIFDGYEPGIPFGNGRILS